jgi:hypothetical protein
MGPDGPVCAATLSLVVRLWSEDGTVPKLWGAVEHVRTGEWYKIVSTTTQDTPRPCVPWVAQAGASAHERCAT